MCPPYLKKNLVCKIAHAHSALRLREVHGACARHLTRGDGWREDEIDTCQTTYVRQLCDLIKGSKFQSKSNCPQRNVLVFSFNFLSTCMSERNRKKNRIGSCMFDLKEKKSFKKYREFHPINRRQNLLVYIFDWREEKILRSKNSCILSSENKILPRNAMSLKTHEISTA